MLNTERPWPWHNMDARTWRVVLQAFHVAFALFCGSLAPAVAFSAVIGPVGGLIAFIVAAGHAALLGLPLAALGAWRGMITWKTAMSGGFIVGALPIGLLLLPIRSDGGLVSLLDRGEILYKELPLAAAWAIDVGLACGAGGCGAVGGLGFWFGWKWIRNKVPLPS